MRRPLPVCRPPEILRALQRAGFSVHHASGSHYIFRHPGRPSLRVTLPFHRGDVKRRVLASILEQAGLTVEEFLELL